jgi:hypothetical protein
MRNIRREEYYYQGRLQGGPPPGEVYRVDLQKWRIQVGTKQGRLQGGPRAGEATGWTSTGGGLQGGPPEVEDTSWNSSSGGYRVDLQEGRPQGGPACHLGLIVPPLLPPSLLGRQCHVGRHKQIPGRIDGERDRDRDRERG